MGERFWAVELGRGRLWVEMQVGWFSGQREMQVFVVAGRDGGGLLG